jgi:hypothetical protein
MSRHRKRARKRPNSDVPTKEASGPSRAEQLRSARRRAGVAKGLVASVAALVFGTAAVFAKQSYPGHPKHATAPLAAPKQYVDVVRQDMLQAGIVAPAQAPPGASTSVS